MVRPLPKGIYTPLPTFFSPTTEDLDLTSFKVHVKYTASAGTVPVVSGTAGEAPHLSHHEQTQLIITAREALDELHLEHVPIVAGVGAPSTRESIQLAKEAADAGADAVMAIVPSYYAGALLSMPAAVKKFFLDLAKESPVPVVIYNFPAITGGIDLDSDMIVALTRESQNICGIKLTCANVGKLTRICAQVDPSFLVIDGFIDFLLPSMSSGSSGAISGLANIAPRTCVKLWERCCGEPAAEETKQLQNLVSLADGVQLKIGIPGMKMWLNRLFGYSLHPRRPLLPMSEEKGNEIMGAQVVENLLEYEQQLGRK